MQIVKEDENHDLLQNMDRFEMNDEKFQLILLATYESDAHCEKVLSGIPFVDKMAKYVIEEG